MRRDNESVASAVSSLHHNCVFSGYVSLSVYHFTLGEQRFMLKRSVLCNDDQSTH